MTRLESDLAKNAADRLEKWAADTLMRCTAVDLPDRTATTMIITCLMNELLNGVVAIGMSREDFLIIMQQGYDTINRLRKSRAEAK